jgi:hypothetical protein
MNLIVCMNGFAVCSGSCFPGRTSTVRDVSALSDFNNVYVRIADIAACLAVLGNPGRSEFIPSAPHCAMARSWCSSHLQPQHPLETFDGQQLSGQRRGCWCPFQVPIRY